MFNRMQVDKHNLRKNITTNAKVHPKRNEFFKFCKTASYMCFVIKLEPFRFQEV